MLLQICTVRDAKSTLFGRPFFTTTIGTALRDFTDETNRVGENNILNTHPEDFSLWHLGTFDDNTGTFETVVPKILAQGIEVKLVMAESYAKYPKLKENLS